MPIYEEYSKLLTKECMNLMLIKKTYGENIANNEAVWIYYSLGDHSHSHKDQIALWSFGELSKFLSVQWINMDTVVDLH